MPKNQGQEILEFIFDGRPGKFNAITDVKGVEVGYSTIISGQGKT